MVQYLLYLAILVALAVPLGRYIGKVMNGDKVFLTWALTPLENLIYRLLRINRRERMDWKRYAASVLLFSGAGFFLLFAMLMLQGILPMNPEGRPGLSWHLAFNTAVSFITNTNWQAYAGESTLSAFSQIMGLTVQNFVSAAAGMAVLFSLIRGFIQIKRAMIGNFWVDVTRSILYVLLPLALVSALLLASQGVVQSVGAYATTPLLEPVTLSDGTVVTQQLVPRAAAASQVAIKQLGTNGGGVMGTNSAHPLENPTALSNLVEMLSILLIPVALCFTFGRNVGDKRQGRAIFLAMFILLCAALAVIAVSEQQATPQLAQGGAVDISAVNQPGGNMEGKEARFGIAGSATWSAFTTAASNGAVNAMHDSYTPLGGMAAMLLMQLGEVVFGGAGSGLCGTLAFVLLTVFIAGLMVGRTPEYLGKKIAPFEMKMAVLICLSAPVAILVGSGVAALVPSVLVSLGNGGPHGFSELLYAYTSAGANNGSAFAGMNADTPFLNLTLGVSMLFARFVPMTATLALAGSFSQKSRVAQSSGTLATHDATFVGLLVFVILLVGALSFFPALALGPIAEYVQMIA